MPQILDSKQFAVKKPWRFGLLLQSEGILCQKKAKHIKTLPFSWSIMEHHTIVSKVGMALWASRRKMCILIFILSKIMLQVSKARSKSELNTLK